MSDDHRNGWPEYQRAVLDKLGAHEDKLDKHADKIETMKIELLREIHKTREEHGKQLARLDARSVGAGAAGGGIIALIAQAVIVAIQAGAG